jgi:hypothetical protein
MTFHGIITAFHYPALHDSTDGQKHGRHGRRLEVSTKVAENLVQPPLFYDL